MKGLYAVAAVVLSVGSVAMGAESTETYICVIQESFGGVALEGRWTSAPFDSGGKFWTYTISGIAPDYIVKIKSSYSGDYEDCRLTVVTADGFQCMASGIVFTLRPQGEFQPFVAHTASPFIPDIYVDLGTCSPS